jgi:hypothetical protein
MANQFVDAITPILNDLTDRFRRGRQATLDEAASFGTEAVRVSARAGNETLDRLGDLAKQRPLLTAAVALGIGMLVGFAARSDWDH